jgi:hypothetical protein
MSAATMLKASIDRPRDAAPLSAVLVCDVKSALFAEALAAPWTTFGVPLACP